MNGDLVIKDKYEYYAAYVYFDFFYSLFSKSLCMKDD